MYIILLVVIALGNAQQVMRIYEEQYQGLISSLATIDKHAQILECCSVTSTTDCLPAQEDLSNACSAYLAVNCVQGTDNEATICFKSIIDAINTQTDQLVGESQLQTDVLNTTLTSLEDTTREEFTLLKAAMLEQFIEVLEALAIQLTATATSTTRITGAIETASAAQITAIEECTALYAAGFATIEAKFDALTLPTPYTIESGFGDWLGEFAGECVCLGGGELAGDFIIDEIVGEFVMSCDDCAITYYTPETIIDLLTQMQEKFPCEYYKLMYDYNIAIDQPEFIHLDNLMPIVNKSKFLKILEELILLTV